MTNGFRENCLASKIQTKRLNAKITNEAKETYNSNQMMGIPWYGQGEFKFGK
jgi:hypothetical protein